MHHQNDPIIYARGNILKQMRSYFNVYSRQVMMGSNKHNNILTYFTPILVLVMSEISVTGALLPQQLTSSMATLLTGDIIKPRNFKNQFQCGNKSNVE